MEGSNALGHAAMSASEHLGYSKPVTGRPKRGFESSDSRGIAIMTLVLNWLYGMTARKFLKFQKILKIQKDQNYGPLAPHPTLCAALRRNGQPLGH
jgi:hypothetical protein